MLAGAGIDQCLEQLVDAVYRADPCVSADLVHQQQGVSVWQHAGVLCGWYFDAFDWDEDALSTGLQGGCKGGGSASAEVCCAHCKQGHGPDNHCEKQRAGCV